jgi:hypothetical protein
MISWRSSGRRTSPAPRAGHRPNRPNRLGPAGPSRGAFSFGGRCAGNWATSTSTAPSRRPVRTQRDSAGRTGQVLLAGPVGTDQHRCVAPSSSATCFRGTASRMLHPTGTDPVKDTTGRRGSTTRAGASSLATVSTANAPAGRSHSAISSPSSSALSGVLDAGFSTIGAPTASAGRHLVRQQVEREVELGDARHRSARNPAGQRQSTLRTGIAVEPLELARSARRLLGRTPEGRRRALDLGPGPPDRLATLAGDRLGELVEALVHPRGHVPQGAAPPVGGQGRQLRADRPPPGWCGREQGACRRVQ